MKWILVVLSLSLLAGCAGTGSMGRMEVTSVETTFDQEHSLDAVWFALLEVLDQERADLAASLGLDPRDFRSTLDEGSTTEYRRLPSRWYSVKQEKALIVTDILDVTRSNKKEYCNCEKAARSLEMPVGVKMNITLKETAEGVLLAVKPAFTEGLDDPQPCTSRGRLELNITNAVKAKLKN